MNVRLRTWRTIMVFFPTPPHPFPSSKTTIFSPAATESKGKASFGQANDQAAFNFLARSLYGANPADSKFGSDGPKLVSKWVIFQLHPLLILGLPSPIEDGILYNFSLPAFLIKKDYQRLYGFFYQNSTPILDQAEKLGVSREEACHNLLFAMCFNSFGSMKFFFPNMLKWVGRLTKSVVYEALRIEPPVASQYAKAKRDFLLESHNAAFRIKEGKILFGFQPFVTKDPRIFHWREEFLPTKFVGENGEKLLKYVVWSNGLETERSAMVVLDEGVGWGGVGWGKYDFFELEKNTNLNKTKLFRIYLYFCKD
ncbi:Allene oxide synthase [Abeliophyllum distichum]|uniref:Allene oxide synthase n=1 Tax=Abeliophyllum distichum TaxID=126358 RepID=A0ABD1RBU9_9LAMI